MAGFSYLLNRRGRYYFRIAIPHALVSRFNARELIYSLKTKNLGEAKLRCRSMHQAALKAAQTGVSWICHPGSCAISSVV
jgi:hypothetical protein